MFLILWQYFIPLIIFAVAYWKILGVVRRQAKIAASRQRKRPVAPSNEAVAETSMITVEQANVAATEDNSQKDKKETVATGPQGHQDAGGQNKPMNKELSLAQINVVKTMVYVTVCFTLCWMPMYLYYLLSTFQVNYINFLRSLLQFFCFTVYSRHYSYRAGR